jgi:hypothetical protein
MTPFHPNDRQLLKTYYEVPADVLEDPARFAAWAEAAAGCAGRREGGVGGRDSAGDAGAGALGSMRGATRVLR